MKYVWVGVVLVAIAGVEFFHEIRTGGGVGAAACVAPELQQGALREALLLHLKAH
jgi:hypothetical protein